MPIVESTRFEALAQVRTSGLAHARACEDTVFTVVYGHDGGVAQAVRIANPAAMNRLTRLIHIIQCIDTSWT